MYRKILYELEDGTITSILPNWLVDYLTWVNLEAEPEHILHHIVTNKNSLAIRCSLIDSGFWTELALDKMH